MNELYIYIFISLRFSVLEEGFEMRELVQCSAGARFDSCMKLVIDADVAKEAACRDEEYNIDHHLVDTQRRRIER